MNTTLSGKNPDKQTLSFDNSAFSSHEGTGKPPKLIYTGSSDEENATSDNKNNDSSRSSKSKHSQKQHKDKKSKDKGTSKRKSRRSMSYYNSSSSSSSSDSSDYKSDSDEEEDPFDEDNSNDQDERNFFRMMKGLQTVLKTVGFGGQREAKFVDLPTFKGGDQDPRDWLE